MVMEEDQPVGVEYLQHVRPHPVEEHGDIDVHDDDVARRDFSTGPSGWPESSRLLSFPWETPLHHVATSG